MLEISKERVKVLQECKGQGELEGGGECGSLKAKRSMALNSLHQHGRERAPNRT